MEWLSPARKIVSAISAFLDSGCAPTEQLLLAESAMGPFTIEAGGATRDDVRPRSSSARRLPPCTLVLAMCMSLTELGHAQASSASGGARVTLNRSTTMTQLSTVD